MCFYECFKQFFFKKKYTRTMKQGNKTVNLNTTFTIQFVLSWHDHKFGSVGIYLAKTGNS